MVALILARDATLLNDGEGPSLTMLVSNFTYAQGALGSITS
jgi:hypothetical protein